MRILAIDPAEYLVGWARGPAGSMPAVGVYKLRKKDERTEDAVERFARWLRDELKEIDLLVVEHFLPPAAAMRGGTRSDTIEGGIGLGYSARTVAALADVHFRSPAPATIRKHFCGQASGGDRKSTKEMVIARARSLGYIPHNCFDDNMADAAALWDFSASYWGRKTAAFQLT